MTLKKKRNNPAALLLLSILLMLFTMPLHAQNEIPGSIKDLVLKGINALESAKSPADIDNALSSFKEAIKLEPSFPDIHYYMGKTLAMLQGNMRNAVKELKKYLELYPGAPDKEQVLAEINKMEESLKSKRGSSMIGVELMALSDGVYVKKVIDKAMHRVAVRFQKLFAGDKIIAVNGDDVTGASLQDVLNKIDGGSADNTVLMISRTGEPFEITVPKKVYTKNLKELDEDDLNAVIKETDAPLIVMWGADPCADCNKYYTDLGYILLKRRNIRAVEVDIEKNKMIGDEFGITKEMIPVINLYKNGTLVKQIKGYDKEDFNDSVEQLMD